MRTDRETEDGIDLRKTQIAGLEASPSMDIAANSDIAESIELLAAQVTALAATNDADRMFTIERTCASWLRVITWIYTIGLLGMNSNQLLAFADFETRTQSPVFIAGGVLSISAIVSAEVVCRSFCAQTTSSMHDSQSATRRMVVISRLLVAVMVLALAGSAWFGAAEVVEVG